MHLQRRCDSGQRTLRSMADAAVARREAKAVRAVQHGNGMWPATCMVAPPSVVAPSQSKRWHQWRRGPIEKAGERGQHGTALGRGDTAGKSSGVPRRVCPTTWAVAPPTAVALTQSERRHR